MRCKKCGYISFDWLETCSNCGKDLQEERLLIGNFIPDKERINWLGMETDQERQQNMGPATDQGPRTGQEAMTPEESPELDPKDIALEEGALKRIAEDEEFQKALEEIAS